MFSTCFPWVFHGFSMGFPRVFHGFSIASQAALFHRQTARQPSHSRHGPRQLGSKGLLHRQSWNNCMVYTYWYL
jgi:hypothetical protein